MELKDQVVSLELAKKLKEIGVKQKSLVYWLNVQHCVHMKLKENGWEVEEDENGRAIVDRIDYRIELGHPIAWDVKKEDTWSAFNVSELGILLPNYVLSNDPEPFNGFRICIEKFISVEVDKLTDNWIINYHCDASEVQGKNAFFVRRLTNNIYDPNLANAMAKMFIFLVENKLTAVPL